MVLIFRDYLRPQSLTSLQRKRKRNNQQSILPAVRKTGTLLNPKLHIKAGKILGETDWEVIYKNKGDYQTRYKASSLLAEVSHDEAKMRGRRDTLSLSFLSFLPRRERPLLARKKASNIK